MKDLTKRSDLALARQFKNNSALYECLRQNSDFSIVKNVADLLFEYTEKQLYFLNLYFDCDSIVHLSDLLTIDKSYRDLPF